MLANIDELKKFNINPILPDISSTYSAVKKYRTKGVVPEEPAVKKVMEANDKP